MRLPCAWRLAASATLWLTMVVDPVAGGSKILTSTNLDMTQIGWMLSAILIFTVLWEEGIERLEHYLSINPIFMEMLGKVYRELMLLGFISLSLILAKEFEMVTDHDLIISFEFAHLLIFGVAMVFIFNALASVKLLRAQQRNWDRIYHVPIDQLVLFLKQTQTEANRTDGLKPLWSTLVPQFAKSRKQVAWEELEWKALRVLFLKEFEFGSKFDYAQYMRHKLMQRLMHTLHVHPITWGVVLVFTVLISFISELISDDATYSTASSNATNCSCCPMSTVTRRRNLGVGGGVSQTRAIVDTLLPMCFAWSLLIIQMLMLRKLKGGVHALFRLKINCQHTPELSGALPKLSADADLYDLADAELGQKDHGSSDHGHGGGHSDGHGGAMLPGGGGHQEGHVHHHGDAQRLRMIRFCAQDARRWWVQARFFPMTTCTNVNRFVTIPAAKFGFLTVPVHVLCLSPGVLLMIYVAPMTHTYFCLLCSVLWRDDEEIAKVKRSTMLVVELRKKVQLALLKKGLQWGQFDSSEPTMADVAKFVFQELDADGGGSLSYQEIREGFPDFDIYLTKHEWTQLLRAIDPDQSGDLTLEEWEDFMIASEEDLLNSEWREFMVVKRARDRIRAMLLTKVMTNTDGSNPKEVAIALFDELDTSNDGELSKEELKDGLSKWDLEMGDAEFDRVWDVIDVNESMSMNRQDWVNFMSASDEELKSVQHEHKMSHLPKAGEILGNLKTKPKPKNPVGLVGVDTSTNPIGAVTPAAAPRRGVFEVAANDRDQ